MNTLEHDELYYDQIIAASIIEAVILAINSAGDEQNQLEKF